MNVKQNLSILFYLKRKKATQDGKIPIYVRITIDGLRDEFSFGYKVSNDDWDDETKRLLTSDLNHKGINKKIGQAQTDIERHFDLMQAKHGIATPQSVKESYLTPVNGADQHNQRMENLQLSESIDEMIFSYIAYCNKVEKAFKDEKKPSAEKQELLQIEKAELKKAIQKLAKKATVIFEDKNRQKTFIQAVDEYLLHFMEMAFAGHRSPNTLEKWIGRKRRYLDFLQHKFKARDIELSLLEFKHLNDLTKYLITYHSVNENTAMKYAQCVKEIIDRCVANGWIAANIFNTFQCTYTSGKNDWPTMDEMQDFIHFEFSKEIYNTIRDIAVFQCFTGYAYNETWAAEPKDVYIGFDGELWITKDRQKTGTEEAVPLLPIVLQVIEKYKNHPQCLRTGRLLPVPTNEYYNRCLKDNFLTNKQLDVNKDGFRDLPTGNQFSMVNRWKFDDGKGFLTQFGFKILNDKRTGGESTFDPTEDKYTTNHYGLGINTERYEGFAKIGYVFPEKKYKSIGLQLSVIDHKQNSYFGLTRYDAKQQNFYSNLIYQSIIGNTAHKFRTGISFLYDKYDEGFKATTYKRKEIVPGAFFEYTYSPSEKISVVAGIRGDHNNLFGFFATPRLHFRYEPVEGTTIRLSAGRGQRTANIFAENSSVFVSSRQVSIVTNETGKAYGLNAETAWNKGISVDQKFKLFQREALFSVDFFRNDFNNQIVVDLENPDEVRFYNLHGKSYSNSLQGELNFEPVQKLDIRLAYRYFDVKTTYSGKLLQRPLIANNRAFGNLAYALNGWKFDYTINFNGQKRIPNTGTNPLPYQQKDYSPSFILMNAQISKTIGKKHPMDFYIGGENLTNYYQKDAIIAADQPFNSYFDASLVWGPITGRMFYIGWRYKIK